MATQIFFCFHPGFLGKMIQFWRPRIFFTIGSIQPPPDLEIIGFKCEDTRKLGSKFCWTISPTFPSFRQIWRMLRGFLFQVIWLLFYHGKITMVHHDMGNPPKYHQEIRPHNMGLWAIITRWWQLKYFSIVTPKLGEDVQFDSYFSKGLKPPTLTCSKHHSQANPWLRSPLIAS